MVVIVVRILFRDACLRASDVVAFVVGTSLTRDGGDVAPVIATSLFRDGDE